MDKDAIFYDPHFLMLGHVVNELSRLRYSMTADENSPDFEEPIVFPWEKQTEEVAVDSWTLRTGRPPMRRDSRAASLLS